MRRRSAPRRSAPIRLIPYGGYASPRIAVHGSLAVALDSGPPPPRVRPPLGIVGDRSPVPRPAPLPRRPIPRTPDTRAGRPAGTQPDVRAGAQPRLRTDARVIAQLVFDVLAGVRPYHHLAGRTTPRVFELLDSLAARIPGRCAPRLATVRVCEPAPGVAEVAAVAVFGSHAQALALRLENDRHRWRCAVIETTVPPPA